MKKQTTYQEDISNPGHPDENELARYAEYMRHEITEVPEALAEHVASCAWCRAELMSITDMLDTLPDLAEEPVSESYGLRIAGGRRSKGSRISLLRAVAAVAAVFLLAWIVEKTLPDHWNRAPLAGDLSSDRPNQRTPGNRTSDSGRLVNNSVSSSNNRRSLIADTIRYASAFIPNQNFENLIGAKYRSGADPKITGPVPGVTFAPGDTLTISFNAKSPDEYRLIILDNKSNTIRDLKFGNKSAGTFIIDLDPGLYYWKFLGRTEMLNAGKLRIIR